MGQQHPTHMIAKISSDSAVEGRDEEVLLGVALGQHLRFRQKQLVDVPVSFLQPPSLSSLIGAPANAPISPAMRRE